MKTKKDQWNLIDDGSFLPSSAMCLSTSFFVITPSNFLHMHTRAHTDETSRLHTSSCKLTLYVKPSTVSTPSSWRVLQQSP